MSAAVTFDRLGVTLILAAGGLLGAAAGLVRALRHGDGSTGRWLAALGRCLDEGMAGAGAGMGVAVLVLILTALFAQLH